MFTLAAPTAALADDWVVNACDEGGGVGTLRYALLHATDPATIDLTSLTACTITLSTGELETGVANVTLNGPGADQLQIDASALGDGDSRVIAPTGPGREALQLDGEGRRPLSEQQGGAFVTYGLGVSLSKLRARPPFGHACL